MLQRVGDSGCLQCARHRHLTVPQRWQRWRIIVEHCSSSVSGSSVLLLILLMNVTDRVGLVVNVVVVLLALVHQVVLAQLQKCRRPTTSVRLRAKAPT